jgi:hypothetical protein
MPLIVCNLPNASPLINGVEFKPAKNGMIAEVSDDVAVFFVSIPGFELVKPQGKRQEEKPAE